MPDLKRQSPFNPKNDAFEPSIETKRKWMLTRKMNVNGRLDKLPGLFSTYNYSSDQLIYFITILLEIFGVWIFVSVSGSPDLIYFAIGFITMNHILVFLSHFISQEKICYAKNLQYLNELIFSKQDDPFSEKPSSSNKKWLLLKLLFGGLITAIAIFKVIFYYYLIGGIIDILSIGIFITFITIAFFHIFHTGYFFSELIVRHSLERDYRKFLKIGKSNQNKYWIKGYRTFHFQSEIDLVPVTIDNGRHHLEKISESLKNNTYQFRSWGILTDEDISMMSSTQKTPNSKIIVNSRGLEHQLQILNRDSHYVESVNLLQEKETPSVRLIKLTHEQKANLKSEIGKNKTIQVINKLIEKSNETNYNIINTLLSLQSQYYQLLNDSTKGIIDYDEETRRRNKINNNLMEIIDNLDVMNI